MKKSILARSLTFAALGGVLVATVPAAAQADTGRHEHHGYRAPAVQEVDLVSDVPGRAPLTDPDLVNPWGLALSPTSPLWSANANTSTATLYSAAPGANAVTKVPTVRVTLPGPAANIPGLPTGQVFNGGNDFTVGSGASASPARFIFSTLTGLIEAWSPVSDPLLGNAEVKASVPGAAYTGLALATASKGDELYAANFGQGRIDVFDASFNRVALPSWAFRDTHLPKGLVPFNVQTLRGNVFVSYDAVNATTGREQLGVGVGAVDEFTPDGRLVERIATHQSLNAPWGLAIAPASWGSLAGSLLVGNFGDGRVNVIKPDGHGFGHVVRQQLSDECGKPIAIPGLWSLTPGTAATGGVDVLWFTAGIDQEQHGLLGQLRIAK
jgi:uncharacterized protein (TIGR03118 family)